MEILTPLQKTFILKFSESPLQETFFLTGGTALSAFYLQHRLSDDLDFFTESAGEVRQILPWVERTSRGLNLKLEIRRQSQSFADCFFQTPEGETLRIDFAPDSPFRFEKTILRPECKIYIDNLTDIACNKLSALYDRAEPKDFVDVYFLDREGLPFPELLEKAKKKHVGLDDYWLAQAFQRIQEVEKLPRMLKPIELETLKNFFNEWGRKLVEP